MKLLGVSPGSLEASSGAGTRNSRKLDRKHENATESKINV